MRSKNPVYRLRELGQAAVDMTAEDFLYNIKAVIEENRDEPQELTEYLVNILDEIETI